MKKVKNRSDFLFEVNKLLPFTTYAVEIGVLHGDFSWRILDSINPEFLVLIDPYSVSESKYNEAMNNMATAYSTEEDYQCLLKRFSEEIKQEKVVVKRDFSYKAVKDFPDEGFHFAYHDASHIYFDLKKDLIDWLPKMKKDCIVAGHDYIEHQSFGVVQAVDEFCSEYNFEMVLLNENGGDWALKRKK